MSRPGDWHLVDLPSDPTPGEGWGARALAGAYGTIADTADDVARVARTVDSTSKTGVWVGQAGDAFRSKLETLPEDAQKCADSYGKARDAMTYWAARLDDTQTRADAGLSQARIAHADLVAAEASVASASQAQNRSQTNLQTLTRLADRYKDTPPPPEVTLPEDWQLRQARNSATTAAASLSGARADVADAQARLDAATRLVFEARTDYEDSARTVVTKLEDAKAVGIRSDSWWESLYHSDAWKVIVAVVTVIVIVAAIVLSGGAALAIILAVGGALLLADSLMAYSEGDLSAEEFALGMVLSFIPGGKLAGTLGKAGTAAVRATSSVQGVTAAAKGGSIAARKLTALEKYTYRRPSGFRRGVRDETFSRAEVEGGGTARDALTGQRIDRTEPWDMGHRPGHEFWKHQISAADRGITRRQFLDEHNDPSIYRPELPGSNRGHRGEHPNNDYFGL